MAMPGIRVSALTAEQEERIKLAAENTCELCREYFPSGELAIHGIGKKKAAGKARDPSVQILVLCRECHRHVHALPVPVARQREIVRRRSFYVRRDIRAVLGYRPEPYEAPESVDIATVYEEHFDRGPAAGPYRPGG
jgi:hypothetical protein